MTLRCQDPTFINQGSGINGFSALLGKIVEYNDIMSVGKQPSSDVAAYKSGTAGNETFHYSEALPLQTKNLESPDGRRQEMSALSIRIT